MYYINFAHELLFVPLQRETTYQMDYKNLEMLSWLVGQFRKAGEIGITFDELMDKLVEEPNLEKMMSKRTFHNYLKELRDRFGIKIECDKRLQYDVVRKALSEDNKRYRYRIAVDSKNDEQWTMPFLMAFETSAIMRRLQNSQENKQFIYIDNQRNGVENVNILLEAIHQQKCVDFYYHHPRTGFPYPQEKFEPRGLVMKDYIWYVLGHTSYRDETIWPLHLLSDIKIKNINYRPDHSFSSDRFWKTHKNLWLEYIN